VSLREEEGREGPETEWEPLPRVHLGRFTHLLDPTEQDAHLHFIGRLTGRAVHSSVCSLRGGGAMHPFSIFLGNYHRLNNLLRLLSLGCSRSLSDSSECNTQLNCMETIFPVQQHAKLKLGVCGVGGGGSFFKALINKTKGALSSRRHHSAASLTRASCRGKFESESLKSPTTRRLSLVKGCTQCVSRALDESTL